MSKRKLRKNRTPEQIAEGKEEALRNEKRRQEKLADREAEIVNGKIAREPVPIHLQGMATAFETFGKPALAGLVDGLRGIKKEEDNESTKTAGAQAGFRAPLTPDETSST